MKHFHLQVANEECVHVSINFSLGSNLRDFSHTKVEQLATPLIAVALDLQSSHKNA